MDDLELPWTFPYHFDLIHTRIMTGSIRDWPQLFRQSFKYVSVSGINTLLRPSIVTDPAVATASLAVGWNVKNWL